MNFPLKRNQKCDIKNGGLYNPGNWLVSSSYRDATKPPWMAPFAKKKYTDVPGYSDTPLKVTLMAGPKL